MRRNLPAGTVTFLFTDVEGSTKLLHELGAAAYAQQLAEHRRVVREACSARGGLEVDTQGDAFFVAFPSAQGALEAAQAITAGLASGPIALRIGLHTGTPLLTEEGYVGEDVHFAARVAASAHGGQIVLSQATRALLDERYRLVELGEHRLKDIPEPVAISQLGHDQFPPLKTISNTNLPRPASSFVGRESELSELLARIKAAPRLLTLTGPGGSGKTRLALEAAASLVPEYKAGVFWVGLASIRDSALVSETIAQTLGAKDGLADHIGDREMLLLLDNLEQVIEAAPKLSSLLQGCPNLTLLVTSRELLRVQGEVEYPVPPLAEAEAVSLFCERAQTAANEAIAELCRRLDHLPLAVELAAARTKALTPRQILERLSQRLDLLKGGRDVDPRQQTLRATIEWSYDLLTPEEQELFRALSVFAGGCTLEAAEDVADADLDTLQSLVEKSLLRFTSSETGSRYWMLETIREYAAERLEHAGETEEFCQRHSDYVLAFVQQASEGLRSPDDIQWMDEFEREVDNLRAALAWMQQTGQPGAQLEVIGRSGYFWGIRGLAAEALRWLTPALAQTRGERSHRRAKALYYAGNFAAGLGEWAVATAHFEESRAISIDLGDDERLAFASCGLGLLATASGDYTEAEQLFEEGILHARRSESPWPLVRLTGVLGDLALQQGQYERAIGILEDHRRLARGLNDHGEEGLALYNLGLCFALTERWDEALAAAKKSLVLSHELRDLESLSWEFVLLACLASHLGDTDTGALLIGEAEALRDLGATVLTGAEAELYRTTLAQLGDSLGEERLDLLRARGHVMTLDEAVDYALASLD